MLTHLRHNAVAYLALAVALGTGSAYAADSIGKGAVTTPKIAKGAVTSAKIKNGSVKRKDLATPPYTFATTVYDTAGPSVSRVGVPFSLPSSGLTTVTVFVNQAGADCDFGGGIASVSVYVDGEGDSRLTLSVPASTQARPLMLGGNIVLGKGPHTARLVYDCFKANQAVNVVTSESQTWTFAQSGAKS